MGEADPVWVERARAARLRVAGSGYGGRTERLAACAAEFGMAVRTLRTALAALDFLEEIALSRPDLLAAARALPPYRLEAIRREAREEGRSEEEGRSASWSDGEGGGNGEGDGEGEGEGEESGNDAGKVPGGLARLDALLGRAGDAGFSPAAGRPRAPVRARSILERVEGALAASGVFGPAPIFLAPDDLDRKLKVSVIASPGGANRRREDGSIWEDPDVKIPRPWAAAVVFATPQREKAKSRQIARERLLVALGLLHVYGYVGIWVEAAASREAFVDEAWQLVMHLREAGAALRPRGFDRGWAQPPQGHSPFGAVFLTERIFLFLPDP